MIPTDQIGAMIDAWSGIIAASRARQGLAPLVDNGGGLVVGQERLRDQVDAPRIVVIPMGLTNFRHEMPAPPTGTAAADQPTGTIADNQPKVLWTAWLQFEAHIWSEEYPANPPKPIWWDFNTAHELFRELAAALYRTCSGPSISDMSYRFEQSTDQARRGRLLVADFAVKVRITDEPYVTLEYGAHPKVEVDVTMSPPVDATIVIPS